MNKIAIYARVSTDDQAEKQTIQTQIMACRDWAKRQGCEIVEEFCDDGVSGAVPLSERPAGSRLLQALESGRVARVVIYCIDRLSRDMESGVPAFNTLRRMSQGVDFVLQSFDDTPEGRFQFNIFMAVADYERGIIARRTMQGQQRRLRAGQKGRGRDPYGYKWNKADKQREKHHWEIVPPEAELIRSIFQQYVSGLSCHEIAARLSEQDIRSPDGQRGHKAGAAGWAYSTVHRLLRRDYYSTGMMTGEFMEEGYSLPVPPVVDTELFNQAQERLRGAQHFPRRRHTRSLFQGLIKCGVCGRGFHRWNYGGKQAATYSCPSRLRQVYREKGIPKCTSPSLKVGETDLGLLELILLSIQEPQELARELLNRIEAEVSASRIGGDVIAQLQDLEERKVAATKLLKRQGMPVATVLATLDSIDKDLERLQARLEGKDQERRALEELQARRDELRTLIDSDARLIQHIALITPDGREIDNDDEDSLAAWLGTERRIRVSLEEGMTGGAEASIDLSTADALLDFLGVEVVVTPNPLSTQTVNLGSPGYPLLVTPGVIPPWGLQVRVNSAWLGVSYSAVTRSPGRTSRSWQGC